MNQILSMRWEFSRNGSEVAIPVPGGGRLTVRVNGDGDAGDVEDVLRAISAIPKLLRSVKDALQTPQGEELYRWKKRELEAAARAAGYQWERECRICGCTDEDCRACVDQTGDPCRWVSEDLCSACEEEGANVPVVFRRGATDGKGRDGKPHVKSDDERDGVRGFKTGQGSGVGARRDRQ